MTSFSLSCKDADTSNNNFRTKLYIHMQKCHECWTHYLAIYEKVNAMTAPERSRWNKSRKPGDAIIQERADFRTAEGIKKKIPTIWNLNVAQRKQDKKDGK